MGRAAGAAPIDGRYLGTMTTVAGAKEMGVAIAWERYDVVAFDSQGANIQSDVANTPVMD